MKDIINSREDLVYDEIKDEVEPQEGAAALANTDEEPQNSAEEAESAAELEKAAEPENTAEPERTAEFEDTEKAVSEAEGTKDASSCANPKTQMETPALNDSRILTELMELRKLYHKEFAGRLKSMQEELEQYRKIDKGRAYDEILSALARVYSTYETLVDEVEEPKAKKSIKYLLMDIQDIFTAYGMGIQKSSIGDKRNPKHSQILGRITTDRPEQHDTVAKSYSPGFYIGNRTIIKEIVDIYFYEKSAETQGEAEPCDDETTEVLE